MPVNDFFTFNIVYDIEETTSIVGCKEPCFGSLGPISEVFYSILKKTFDIEFDFGRQGALFWIVGPDIDFFYPISKNPPPISKFYVVDIKGLRWQYRIERRCMVWYFVLTSDAYGRTGSCRAPSCQPTMIWTMIANWMRIHALIVQIECLYLSSWSAVTKGTILIGYAWFYGRHWRKFAEGSWCTSKAGKAIVIIWLGHLPTISKQHLRDQSFTLGIKVFR